MKCIRDYIFNCPRRFTFYLSDPVGAFGFICLRGRVGELEFTYSSVCVGAFRIDYVFSASANWSLCFYLSM